MASVQREIEIETSAARAWDALRDVGALHTRLVPGFVTETKLEPGARLGFICWRAITENPWMLIPCMAAVQHLAMPPMPAPGSPGPFAFAESDHVTSILSRAGFKDIAFERVDETLDVGAGTSLDETVQFLLQMGPTANTVRDADPDVRQRVFEAVREAVQPYDTPKGLRMASACWVVTARNP